MTSPKTLISQAVGLALLASSGAALAYVPTSNTDADVVVYWGGATASTLSAQELAVAAVCDTDPHLLYVKATSGTPIDRPGNDWAVACKAPAAAVSPKTGLPAGTRILLIKRDRGGSGVGVGPVQTKGTDTNSGLLDFLTVTPAVCGIAVTAGVNGAPEIANPDGGSVPVIGCAATYTTNAYAEIGTSDIEPNKFFGINTPNIGTVSAPVLVPYRTKADRQFQEQASLAALTFNTPVSLSLYRLLQAEQFAGTVCDPDNNAFNDLTAAAGDRTDTTNAESEACMPSLTRQEIASLFTGRIVQWQALLEADGTTLDNIGTDPALTGLPVQICRRVEGSGSQATINALVMNWPCDANRTDLSLDIVNPRTAPASTATLVLNSGSGDVDNCLNNFDASTTNPYAIGLLSVEGRNNNNLRNWRYIKIDGIAPTLRNIHAGDYWLWAQQSCQRRRDTLPYNNIGAVDTIGNKDRVFDALCGNNATNGLNSIATLTKLNNPLPAAAGGNCPTDASTCGSFYTFGQSGWLATPTAALAYDVVLAPSSRPVNAFTREVSTGVVNHCQVAMKSIAAGSSAKGVIVAPNPTWNP
jgi:ABC-type phosphate transport system substrate-binding protein